MKKTNIKQKASGAIKEFRQLGFNGTREGQYISLKEFLSYSLGGMGVTTLFKMVGYVAMTANCLLLGSVFGIRPTHLAYMNIAVILLNIIKTPIISMFLDNTNTKYGKFRPVLLWAGFPASLLLSALTFVPLDMDYTLKCVVVCILFFFMMAFQTLHLDAYKSLAQVMTSNTTERATLISISQIIYNLSPSIIGLIFPILAKVISPELGLLDIKVYRILFPLMSIPGVLVGFIVAKNTKERIVVPKNYVAKVKFSEGFGQIMKNKYFWIITSADIFMVLRTAVSTAFLNWYCVYHLENQALLGVLSLVIGNAYLPGMLLAPIMIKKLGARNAQLFGYTIHAIFAGVMLLTMDNTILFLVSMYLCIVGVGSDFTIRQTMWSNIYDYQQLKTGQRIEGFITQFTITIGATISILVAPIMPALQEHFGLKDDYNVLFDAAIRHDVFAVIIWATLLATIGSMIPFFFYDLTEKKHAKILEELKERAALEDAKVESK